jgi:hypothetical protein
MARGQLSEVNTDTIAMDLVESRLRKAMYTCVSLVDDKIRTLNGMIVCDRAMLIPAHFFLCMRQGQIISLTNAYRKTFNVVLDFNDVATIPGRDVCMWLVPPQIELGKDNVTHFVREDDLSTLENVGAALLKKDIDGNLTIYSVNARAIDKKIPDAHYTVDSESGKVTFDVRNGWKYNLNTVLGDCGSILIAMDPRVKHKLLGFHVCGIEATSTGWSQLITYEEVISLLETLLPKGKWKREVSEAVVQFREEPPKMIPIGDFSVLGTLIEDKQFLSMETSLRKYPWFDLVGSDYQPAVMNPKDDRLDEPHSIVGTALQKWGRTAGVYDLEAWKLACLWQKEDILKIPDLGTRMPRTLTQVLNGVPGHPYYTALDLTTSAGWPLTMRGMKRKDLIHGPDGFREIVNIDLAERVHQRISLAKRGILLEPVWMDCPKDELLKPSKIKSGSTRMFCIAPIDLLIVMKMYFEDFTASYYASHCKFYSTIGLNPESFEWEDLKHRLEEIGAYFSDLDAVEYDSSVYVPSMEHSVNAINSWYNVNPSPTIDEDNLVRLVCFEACIHRKTVVLDCLYIVHNGNPSGGFLTAIFNGDSNAINVRYSYIKQRWRRGEKAIKSEFDKDLRDQNHGDDLLLSCSDLNRFSLVEMIDDLDAVAVHYTSAEKDRLPSWKRLADCMFLKRNFVQIPELPYTFALLGENSIKKILAWRRKTVGVETAWIQALQTVSMFLLADPQAYNKYKILCERICREYHLDGRFPEWSVCFYEVYGKVLF